MRFSSKIDPWVGALLIMAPVLSLIGGMISLSAGERAGMIGPVFIGLLYAVLVLPIRYELAEEALVIRFGLMRSRVPYAQIRAVRPTGNALSSPALSLDRLHIDAGSPLGPNISPEDKAAFLAALAPRVPHLRLRDGALLPA